MRIRRALAMVLVLAAGPVAGCGDGDGGGGEDETAAGPGLHPLTLDYRDEPYLLYVPESYDPDTLTPLVITLHGRPGTAAGIAGQSRLNPLADQERFLVAYPESSTSVVFMRELVGHLVDTWHADPDAVYITGFSAGASTAWDLAAEAADLFAAAAPMSGPLRGKSAIEPAEPISVMAFIGLNDRPLLNAMESGVAHWQKELRCQESKPELVDKDKSVSRTVAPCADGSEVVTYRIEHMGHIWANRAPGFDPNQAIWDFFVAHRR